MITFIGKRATSRAFVIYNRLLTFSVRLYLPAFNRMGGVLKNSEELANLELPELVRAIREDRPGAADELVSRFGRGVRYALRRESHRPFILEDLFQETFCVALAQIKEGRLKDSNSLGSFLYGIARLTAWDTNRSEKKRQERYVPLTTDVEVHHDPYHQLQIRESAQLVRKVINQLPSPRDREVLFRVYLAEEDRAQICSDLDLSPQQFNLILHRARERYRDLYLSEVNLAST